MKTKEDFKFLIGKTLDQSNQLLEHPYFIWVSEQDGRTYYRSIGYNPFRIIVATRGGIIIRIDDVC